MVCDKVEAEAAEAEEEAGYRIKNKTQTKMRGKKKNCQETPRMNDEIPTLMLGFIEKPQG
jgi:hypothetical protein